MIRRFLLFLALAVPAAAQIPAFPGAEGFGAYATGGRGGDVYHVTNLNASGAGSFADAIATVPSAGRTIVFDVSGYIRLPSGSNGTRMTASKVTIAGQTAPGDGVGFYNNFFRISGDDIVIRHLRFRMGKYGSGGDCIDLDSGSLNTILDSLSLQFSTDENISSFGSPPENLTMQWSLNGWGLESHSCGGLWDQNHASAHHSLWSHNHTRNPKARPNGLLEWVNNVTFDWDIGFIMGDSPSNASWKANVRGNYFLCPPGNLRSKALEKATLQTSNGLPNFSLYLDNCLHDNDGDGLLNGTDKGYAIASGSYNTNATPFAGSTAAVTIDPPLAAFKKVLSKAGARRLDVSYAGDVHDEVDARMISNVLNQTANHITRESDLAGVSNAGFGTLNSTAAAVDTDRDGMPDFYETALGWAPGTQDHGTVLANSGGLITGTTFFPPATVAGYTRLEEYLHFLSIPHGTLPKNITGTPSSIQVDLLKFTKGFVKSPVFTLTNVINGTTTQSGAGNHLVTFTPTLNHVGRAKFDFTVTDADGSTWTQTCALLVSSSGLPRDLSWKGDGTANTWDDTSNNWLRGAAATAFSFGDRVTFDDSGSKSPAVNVTGTMSPSTVDVNAGGNYTFGGTGSVNSTGALTKSGSGTLTLNNSAANGFSAVTLESGTIVAGRTDSIGAGTVTCGGGSLTLPGTGGTFSNALTVNGNSTLNWASNSNMYFSSSITGAGQLNLNFSNKLFSLQGSWANFSGTLDTGTSTGTLRINNSNSLDFSKTKFQLGNASIRHHLNNAQSIPFGELNAGSGAYLTGGDTNYAVTDTYTIGGLNTDSTFAGTIADGSGTGHKLGITKTGTGTLTLGGANTYTGATAVSQGALLVDGSLGNTAVTVAGGTLLGGDGTLGGSVTASSGAILSPGTIPFTGATMTVTGALALNGNTLYYDMSNSPAGANDRINAGGPLALTGTQYFQFLLLNGTLAAGTYDLITATGGTASGVSLTHNLPTDSRQTFALDRSAAGSNPTKVWLTVTGNPATLTWTGAANGTWDTATADNWSGATPNTFYNNDDVVLNDSATTRTVVLSGTVSPRTAAINTTAGYTITGSGLLGGNAVLTKTGGGILSIANTGVSTFSGGTLLNGGGITLNDSTANTSGLGTGAVTFNGGTLTMAGFNGSNADAYSPMSNNLMVPAGQSGTLNLTQRAPKPGSANVFPAIYGNLSGAGTLNLAVKFIRGDVLGDWSPFTGTLNVVAADSDGGDFRFGTSYAWAGMPNATVNLGAKMAAYYVGTSNSGAGTTVTFGELSGTPTSKLLGGTTGGRNFAYRIGGKTAAGNDVLFAGTIAEQSSGVSSSIVKTGAGSWTLGGSGGWNGGTTIEQGTLRLTGAFASAGATDVNPGASMKLEGGSLATDAVNVSGGATFSGYGGLEADLIVDGICETRGFSTGTPGNLAVTGNVFLGPGAVTRMRGGAASDLIAVTGDLALGGTIQITLTAGTGFGRYPLMTCAGILTGSAVLAGIPAGITAQLSTNVSGRVDLVIDDRDEDGLPDSWEQANFGNLTNTADGDRDGDGSSNLVEYRLGLNPSNGASAFRTELSGHTLVWPSSQGVVFTVKRSVSLQASDWQIVGTVVGGTGSTASFNDPSSFERAFYRVEFTP